MLSSHITSTLIQEEDAPWEEIDAFCKRKIMAYNQDLMLVKVAFKKDGIGALHHHPHLQISYVAKGKFEVNIGEQTKLLQEGDVYFVPSDAVHGVVCVEDGLLIDVFNPCREDFL